MTPCHHWNWRPIYINACAYRKCMDCGIVLE